MGGERGPEIRVTRLFIYPLKSGQVLELDGAEVDSFGFHGDRRWMVVDNDLGFLTQREHPRLALIGLLRRQPDPLRPGAP